MLLHLHCIMLHDEGEVGEEGWGGRRGRSRKKGGMGGRRNGERWRNEMEEIGRMGRRDDEGQGRRGMDEK